jgi:MSHA biogenesis protein MshG
MTAYAYTGRSLRGDAVAGRIDADSPQAVAMRLLHGGITPIDIVTAEGTAPTQSGGVDMGSLALRLGLGKPTTADLILLTRQFYTITKSGIPLLRGLRALSASTRHPVLRSALDDMVTNLEGGHDLSSSFARLPHIFSPIYIGLVTVGEATGTLENSFLRLGEYLAQEQNIQTRVKGAVRYPAMVMLVIAAAMAVLTLFVIPKFAPLFHVLGDQIPWPTKIIMGASDFAQHYWKAALGGGVLAALGVNRLLHTPAGRLHWDRLKLRIPVIGTLLHQAILARVMRTLSVSLQAGMPMLQTLATIARGTGNEHVTEAIHKLREAVERGEPMARAAATVSMFPPLVLQMIAVGEETGALPDLLEEVAGFYEREVDNTVNNLSSAVEPILIVFVGGMVLILALGVFLPMWDMIAKVGGGH